MQQEILTFCAVCAGACAVKAIVKDGKLVKVEADKESGLHAERCPGGKGWRTEMGILNHPDRLKYPMKRVGARGEGKWQRISWDEALGTTAERLMELKKKFGPESVGLALGEPNNMEFAFGERLATAFGTPNVATPGNICGVPEIYAGVFTYGAYALADEANPPSLIIEWGGNPLYTANGLRRGKITKALKHGAKMVWIDPRKPVRPARTNLWLRPSPGSDGALAMGMLKVIIEQRLYDQNFVANWTVGFDQLEEEVKTFTLDDVARLTWVPREQIEEVARLYAGTKPATIINGNALEQIVNSFQTLRAICILRAITGNLNVPGGDVFLTPAPFTRLGRFFLLPLLPRKPEKTLGNEFKLTTKNAFIPYQSLVRGILEEKPYPVKAVLTCLSNPLSSYPDAEATYRAFMKLEFSVVLELFMTPTAAIADIVLPAAQAWEDDTIGYWPGWWQEIRAYRKIAEPPGEAWPDIKILNELAKRLGLGKYFWEDERESFNEMLRPSGLSFEDFLEKRTLLATREYKKPEEGGIKTPSGKVEIYSQQMKELGYSPIPRWRELSQVPKPSAEYPLLLTNAKENYYKLTGFKMLPELREKSPQPLVWLNPETAREAGLSEGDWIQIETTKGRITQQLALDDNLDPRVVFASFGWWFPEDGEDTLYGWRRANLNILISYEPEEPELGTTHLRGIPCRVSKAQETKNES